MSTRTEMKHLRRLLDANDLDLLLMAEPGELIGCILRMNRAPRYRNALDAILLTASLLEVRAHRNRGVRARVRPVSSPEHPASSD
jgi:hypothetical protein